MSDEMDSTRHSACPVVSRRTMTLYERVTVGGKSTLFPFTYPILWLRESETQVVIRHRGEEVRQGSRSNDWHGYLTSLVGVIREDVPRISFGLRLQPGDALTIDLDTTIRDVPVREDTSDEAVRNNTTPGRRHRQYLDAPSYHNGGRYWFTSDKAVGTDFPHLPTLEPIIVGTFKAVYSTGKYPPDGTVPDAVAKWIEQHRDVAAPAAPSPGEGA